MKNDHRLTESTNLAFFLKPVWQDLWHGRLRIVLLFSTSLTLLLWSSLSARSYDLLYTMLVMMSTVLPLIYLVHALFQSESCGSENELSEDGLFRIAHLDDRNVIPLAVLTVTIMAASAALLQVPALRATMQNPLALAPGRWTAALSTAMVTTILCHMGFMSFGFCLEKPLTRA